jgi:hypothetical protein
VRHQNFDFSGLMSNCIIKNNLVAFTAVGLNFDEFKFLGLHERQAVVTENLRRTNRPVYLMRHGPHRKRKN